MSDLVLCCALLLLPFGVLRSALTFFLLVRGIRDAYAHEAQLAAVMACGSIDLSRFARPALSCGQRSAVYGALRVSSHRPRSSPADDEDP